MSFRIRKQKRSRSIMSDLMEFHFGAEVNDLGSFKDLPRREQGLMLLRRLAYLFPHRRFLDIGQVNCFDNWDEVVYGFPASELRDASLYLRTYPWSEIVRAGYVAEAPRGMSEYQITALGWAVVMKERKRDRTVPAISVSKVT